METRVVCVCGRLRKQAREEVGKMRVRNTLRLSLVAALAVAITAGCGGGGGGSSIAPQPINRAPALTVVDPDPNPATLDISKATSMQLCFRGDDPDGGELSYVCTWDAGSVTPAQGKMQAGSQCVVNFNAPSYNGLCTVTVIVSDGQASAEKQIKINVVGAVTNPDAELRVLGMTVSPSPVPPGGAATLTASVQNEPGKTLTYKWESMFGKVIGNGVNATWNAPTISGVYGVYVTVSDGVSQVKYGQAVSVAAPEGGVLGQYFKTVREMNVVRLQTEVLTRIDPDINFNWYKLSPDPAKLGGDGWGARWTGYIKAEAAGTYVFRVHVDDGARMKVMDDSGAWVAVIPNTTENWIDHVEGAWLPAQPVPLQLSGGKWYPFEIEYFEGAEEAFIVLYWSVNGGPEEIVPQSVLKPQ